MKQNKILSVLIIPVIMVMSNLLTCFSQSFTDLNYKAPTVTLPEVSAMMKYVDYPVDLYNGLVDITIPLYTVESGDISLPVTLSYHASGLKLREPDGRIALGWTLNAEPSVSRQIRGNPDEDIQGYFNSYYKENDINYLKYDFEYKLSEGEFDLLPDMYYYKLIDKSGKFFFYKSNTTIPRAPLEIIPIPKEPVRITGAPDRFFEITDDNGLHYTFGTTDPALSYSNFPCGMNFDYKKIQWFATSVTSIAKRHTISFTYKPMVDILLRYLEKKPYCFAVEDTWMIFDFPYGSATNCDALISPFLYRNGPEANQGTIRSIIQDPNYMYGYYDEKKQINVLPGVLSDEDYGAYYGCDADHFPKPLPNAFTRTPLIESINSSTVNVEFVSYSSNCSQLFILTIYM